MLWCENLQQAIEHIHACAREMATKAIPDSLKEEESASKHQARAVRYLASVWGFELHEVEFLLATRPLHSLSLVNSEEEWNRLVRETAGLIHPDLCVSASSLS